MASLAYICSRCSQPIINTGHIENDFNAYVAHLWKAHKISRKDLTNSIKCQLKPIPQKLQAESNGGQKCPSRGAKVRRKRLAANQKRNCGNSLAVPGSQLTRSPVMDAGIEHRSPVSCVNNQRWLFREERHQEMLPDTLGTDYHPGTTWDWDLTTPNTPLWRNAKR